jgi:hypothetical protein
VGVWGSECPPLLGGGRRRRARGEGHRRPALQSTRQLSPKAPRPAAPDQPRQGPLERALGARRSALLRLSLGLGSLAALSLAFPSAAAAPGLGPLLGVTAAIGAAYSLAFGCSYQMAPAFGPECTVALTAGGGEGTRMAAGAAGCRLCEPFSIGRPAATPSPAPPQPSPLSRPPPHAHAHPGFVSAGLLVLALDFAIKRGAPHYTPRQLRVLFAAVAAACLGGLAAGAALLRAHGRRLEAAAAAAAAAPPAQAAPGGGRAGAGAAAAPAGGGGAALAAVGAAGGTAGALRAALKHTAHHAHPGPDPAPDVEAPPAPPGRRGRGAGGPGMLAVAAATAPAAAALLASVGSSMLAFPFFSYAPPTGRLGHHISQALFYSRLGGDIAGRLVPPSLQARTGPRLLAWAGLKAALLPWLVPALLRPARAGGDLGLLALVGLNWAMSGYINTGAILVAPTLVAPAQRGRVGGFMALSFQVRG